MPCEKFNFLNKIDRHYQTLSNNPIKVKKSPSNMLKNPTNNLKKIRTFKQLLKDSVTMGNV